MFILRNYNKFLTGSKRSFEWVDLDIHRFASDFDKLVKFDSVQDAQEFINQHYQIERDFDAWIMEADHWDH